MLGSSLRRHIIARRFYSKCSLLDNCYLQWHNLCRGQLSVRTIANISDTNVIIKETSPDLRQLQHIVTSGELDLVSLYLKQAVKNKRQLTTEELELVLYSCAKVGDCSLAESIFQFIQTKFGEPSPQCCRLLLECYSLSGNLQIIWQRLERLVKDNLPLDADSFRLIQHCILIFQRGDKEMLDKLHHLGSLHYPKEYDRFISFPSHSVSTLMIQHSFHDDTKQLRRVFHRYVARHSLDLWTLRIATVAFLRSGYPLALEITQFIHDRCLSNLDISSSTKTIHDSHFLWNDIVSRICIRASLPPRLKPLALLSMQIVESLNKSSLILEETTKLRYLSLKRFHSSFLVDWRDDWQKYMLLQRPIPGTASKQSYHGMLRSLLVPSKPSAYLLGESESLWKELENCGWLPDLDSYFLLISHFALNRELNSALQCYKDMCDKGIRPTTFILYQLLEACTKSRNAGNRLTFLRDQENTFLRKDIAPWYVRSILERRQQQQQQQRNLTTDSDSCEPQWSRHRYGISAILEQNADIALKLATEWSRWQLPVKTVAFVKLAQILADAGRQECLDVLSQMENNGMELREYFLASLLKRFLYNGSFQRRVGFRELYRFVEKKYPQAHHPWMVDSLLLYYSDGYQFHQILPLVVHSVKDNHTWPTTSGMTALLKAIMHYANDPSKAKEHLHWFMKAAEKTKSTPRQLQQAVVALKENGQHEMAETLKSVGQKYPYRRQFTIGEDYTDT
ncbi:hypothetical protein GAYE_SCF29G4807 [Galdieria yellowstonensis]|uniref:Uncharacterized protein n=1 Tax=Galdieria yellowstonensis TaxID=3028027 RepID=A0AAV9IHS8_9RHOD|nr:hypothetical protein GAYE_SCF29G4807 [Galdieria yellowstonensis]